MAADGPLERFLKAVHAVRATGAAVPETSYYPAISRLLEDVGMTLTPKVRPVINIRDQGSGIPDGGLFVVRAGGPVTAVDPMVASIPERGAVEVKPPDRDITKVATSKQVRNYLDRYGKVLVTTMRDWTLVVADASGRAKRTESFQLAGNDDAFWAIAAHPADAVTAQQDDFVGFLRRVMEHDAPLSSPRDLAWTLAAHARTALQRIEEKDVGALDQLRTALSDGLGLTFHDEDGEHFFRSTLVQTLFYGVFSAWVLWHQADPAPSERFQWRQAGWHLRVPIVRGLFEKIATYSTLRPLGVDEVMDWTEDVLARVDRVRFFDRFEHRLAVQYFYEPFLEHFDARLREQFGVWYTPTEVVDYMVERVDQTLRSEFGIEKGLADDRVVVLDPCVGTGSYLLAVLARIADSLPDDALAADDVKQAAMQRVFGFEILPAPFIVAHLQLGLLLDHLGAPLDLSRNERAAVFLTNALTGWADDGHTMALPFPELEQERESAHAIKRDAKILVVLGNPPYYPFAGVNSAEEAGLIEPYKQGITTRHSLNDLYVRFIRVAERRIVEGTGHGIVCFISNFSYLHEPGFAQMRRVLLDEFDTITIDNLNGDSRETGKKTPDGKPDPSIFSTAYNRQGIQVGTAVALYVRRREHEAGHAPVRYRDFWGESKPSDLLRVVHSDEPEVGYAEVLLTDVNRLAFRPGIFSADYESWPQIVELAASDPVLGLLEKRGSVLIDPDRDALAARMRKYLDPSISFEQLKTTDAEELTRPWARFDAKGTRDRLLASGGYDEARLVRFVNRPLDVQWAYVDPTPKLWNEVRAKGLVLQTRDANRFLLVRRRAPRLDDGAPLLPATCLGEEHALHKDAYFIPYHLHPAEAENDGLFHTGDPTPNLSSRSLEYLGELGIAADDPDFDALLWWHALAIAYSPRYVADNPGGIAADWPRIPLPETVDALSASADLGRRLADLLDPLRPLPAGVPSVVGPLRRSDGRAAQPSLGHLDITVQWGIVQKSGAVMPGRGKLERRPFTEAERTGLGESADSLGAACDVYLNDGTYWACIPERVWEFKIGGFQVLKKWLSYREHGTAQNPSLLGRGLTVAEARDFTALAQRLTAVVLLAPALDENYQNAIAHTWPWAGVQDAESAAADDES